MTEMSYEPDKLVAAISEEIDNGTRALYPKKIAPALYEKEVK